MTTKLTLTIKKEILERAKSYSKETGIGLSELVENYLNNLTQEQKDRKVSTILQKLVGAVKLPKNFDEKKELRTNFEKKHLI